MLMLRFLLEVKKGVLRSGLLAHLLVCAALADMEGCVVLNKLQLVTGRLECKWQATYHPDFRLLLLPRYYDPLSFLFLILFLCVVRRWPFQYMEVVRDALGRLGIVREVKG